MYFLDTNTCIDFLRGKNTTLWNRFNTVPSDEMKIPAVVKAELLAGALKSNVHSTLERTERFLEKFEIISFTDGMTHIYARLRADLEKQGLPIGSNDMLIAATALYCKATLVTHNTGEFSRVTGLLLEDWSIE